MKAVLYEKYGSPEVLEVKEVAIPVPKDNEVLIKIHAATVTAGDCELRSFTISPLFWLPLRIAFGIRSPKRKILGQEFSGEIVEVGKEVTQFKQGDQVFCPCDINFGAYAEYITIPAKSPIALKPANLSYEEAATIPTGGLNALHFLRKVNLQPGEHILINGAGGSIGTCGVQLAKFYGAKVTAIDSGTKLDMLTELGADHVIDYTKEDFTKNGVSYDVIFDIVGKAPFVRSFRSLKPKGRYISAMPELGRIFRGMFLNLTSNKKMMTGLASYKTEDLEYLANLYESGELKAAIDRQYSLEGVADAHRYVESGLKIGNLTISI